MPKTRFASRANRVVRIAKSEIGYHEGRTGNHWNNEEKYAGKIPGLEWANFQAWCATFVSWVAMTANVANYYPRTASCDVAAGWFKMRDQWSEYPAVGAQVFYGTPNDLVHTGIVTDFDDEFIYTVEGNTNNNGSREGDGVYAKKRPRYDNWVVGYGYPKFKRPLRSADPVYNDEYVA